MSLSKSFKTDLKKEIDGVGVSYGFNEDGTEIKFFISRMSKSNKAYSKALEKATRPYRRQFELGTMDEKKAEDIFMEVFSDTILKGWENVPKSDITGNKEDKGYAEFSRFKAVDLFKRLPDLYQDLQDKANSAALFREEALEEEAKN